ncbi:hypothetical protein IWZ01DRAFT_529635 [Phyllosticta capitalensis]
MAPVSASSNSSSKSRWEAAFDDLTEKERSQIEPGNWFRADSSLPKNLMLGIEKQKAQCESRQWVLYTKKDGTQVKLRELLGKVADHVTRFKSIVVGFILQSTTRDIQKFAEMIEGVELVAHNTLVFAEVEKDSLGDNSALKSELSFAVVQLYASILRYLSTARAYYSQRTLKRFFKSFFEDAGSASALLDQIRQSAKDAHTLADRVEHKDAKTSLGAIEKHFADAISSAAARREKLLNLLNASYTDGRYHDALKKRHKNTCNWILDQPVFQQWTKEIAGMAKILWIHGAPGFGKSYLSARIVSHLLQHNPKRVAYFFVSNDDTSHIPHTILRSWISQIIQQSDEAIPVVEKALSDGVEEVGRQIDSKLWKLLSHISKGLNGVTLVLDGLDELSPVSQAKKCDKAGDDISQFLRDLKDNMQKTSARILVVSRDVLDIRREMTPEVLSNRIKQCQLSMKQELVPHALSEGILAQEFRITPKDMSSDIDAYSQKVYEGAISRGLKMTRSEFVSLASEKSEGMFLWLRFLERGISESRSQGSPGRVLKDMPRGVEKIYEKELINIFGPHVSPENRDLAATVLRWVLYATRPLTLATLAEALALPFDDKDIKYPREELPDCWESCRVDELFVDNVIRRTCRSFLTLRSGSLRQLFHCQTVHFVHFSIKEYLLRPRRNTPELCEIPDFSDSLHQNIHLARSCMQFLSLDIFGQEQLEHRLGEFWRALNKSGTGLAYWKYCEFWDDHPFLHYAAANWFRHLPSQIPSEASASVRRLLSLSTTNWRVWAVGVEIRSSHSLSQLSNHDLMNSSPIYYAAEAGLLNVVKFLHSEGHNLESTGDLNGFPFQAAVWPGHFDVVEYLIQSGADVNQRGGYLGTALHAAVDCLDRTPKAMVQLLLDYGANTTSIDDSGRTPLNVACFKGKSDIAMLLWNALDDSDRISIVSLVGPNGHTLLTDAAHGGLQDFVELLLDRGAAGKIKALELAASEGHGKIVEVVKILLDYGADIASHAWSLIRAAGVKGHIKTAQLLVERGAVVDFGQNLDESEDMDKCSMTDLEEQMSTDGEETDTDTAPLADGPMVEQSITGRWRETLPILSGARPRFIMSIFDVEESSKDTGTFKGDDHGGKAGVNLFGQVCLDQNIWIVHQLSFPLKDGDGFSGAR